MGRGVVQRDLSASPWCARVRRSVLVYLSIPRLGSLLDSPRTTTPLHAPNDVHGDTNHSTSAVEDASGTFTPFVFTGKLPFSDMT